jgi:hypothetical protein
LIVVQLLHGKEKLLRVVIEGKKDMPVREQREKGPALAGIVGNSPFIVHARDTLVVD